MAHHRSASLRNRKLSDATHAHIINHPPREDSIRQSISERRPPYVPQSASYMNEDDADDSFDERSWSPASVENGTAQKQKLLNVAPLSPPPTLPSGASTPAFDTTRSGRPVSNYPPEPPTWLNMPNKGQLAVLAASRFVDFFQMAALQTFMVHQLKSFDPMLPTQAISHQAGTLQGAFTAAQIVTSILWGRIADQPQVGRKMVLQIGLIGTGFGCIGVAFSGSYGQAVFWRLMSGAINGTVGSARTMVAEVTPKPWHPRAFLLLPAAFNIANVFGPILAGLLAEPLVNFPHLFGPGSTFGGAEGITWMRDYPYALANLISTVLLFTEAVFVHFFLTETLKGKRPFEISKLNPLNFFRLLTSSLSNVRNRGHRIIREQRQGLLNNSDDRNSFEMSRMNSHGVKDEERPAQVLPFRRIWTSNVLWVLVSVAIFDFHMGAFAQLWILFLATPRIFIPEDQLTTPTGPTDPQAQAAAAAAAAAAVEAPPPAAHLLARSFTHPARSFFKFAAGLAFPPPTIGFAMAIIGFIGVALQFILYPWANSRFGLMRAFRGSLFMFPCAYFLAPYIALLPSTSAPPAPASGATVWSGISFVLFLQVAARTFALPATIILINNSSPHPSVLGTIHGVGQATSATFRTLGPMLAGSWYGDWTERGIVGMAWWIVALVASVGCVAAFWVRNGSGHEIFLPGEEGEEKSAGTAGGSGDGR